MSNTVVILRCALERLPFNFAVFVNFVCWLPLTSQGSKSVGTEHLKNKASSETVSIPLRAFRRCAGRTTMLRSTFPCSCSPGATSSRLNSLCFASSILVPDQSRLRQVVYWKIPYASDCSACEHGSRNPPGLEKACLLSEV